MRVAATTLETLQGKKKKKKAIWIIYNDHGLDDQVIWEGISTNYIYRQINHTTNF